MTKGGYSKRQLVCFLTVAIWTFITSLTCQIVEQKIPSLRQVIVERVVGIVTWHKSVGLVQNPGNRPQIYEKKKQKQQKKKVIWKTWQWLRQQQQQQVSARNCKHLAWSLSNPVPLVIRSQSPSKESKMGTLHCSPVVWPSPYACPQPYHSSRYQTKMDSCFGLVRLRLFSIADNYSSRVLQIPLRGSSALQMW